jgi:hypothetical protein
MDRTQLDMKLSLKEVKVLVRSILMESVCKKCGYDNPYMDDDPNYVCRQCKAHADKFRTSQEKCIVCNHPIVRGADDETNGTCGDRNCDCCGPYEGDEAIRTYDEFDGEQWVCPNCNHRDPRATKMSVKMGGWECENCGYERDPDDDEP